MADLLLHSVYFGVFLSLFCYWIGMLLKKRFKLVIFNPLLIADILIIAFLLVFKIDYHIYQEGARYISYLLTPATICLAVPLYEQFELLKKNAAAVVIGIASGVLTSLVTIFVLAKLFMTDRLLYITLLPKSITTAIAIGLTEELGGYVSITVAAIIITGLGGHIFAEILLKIFGITEPIAKGVAIGTASHAMGTAKAMEIGEIEGAMSSLSIVVAGLLTVVGAAVFANFM